MVKTKMKNAEFLKDAVFFDENGAKRSISASWMKKKKRKISIPVRYWESFALKGIVKATDNQLEAIKKKHEKVN